jgi:hypothetical protein
MFFASVNAVITPWGLAWGEGGGICSCVAASAVGWTARWAQERKSCGERWLDRRGAEVDGILVLCIKYVHSCHILCPTSGRGVEDGGSRISKVKYKTGHWAHSRPASGDGTCCETHGVGEVRPHEFCAPSYLRPRPRRHT